MWVNRWIRDNWHLFAFLSFSLVVFAVMNWLTPMVTDDYYYTFQFTEGKANADFPVQNFWDVLASQMDHYLYHNGRFFVHLTLQTIDALFGKWLFNVLNPVFFGLYILLLVRYALNRITLSPVVLTLCLLYFFMPVFKEFYLWMAGGFNYLWSSVLVLYFLLVLNRRESERLSGKSVWFLILSLVAGWTHEGITIPLSIGLLTMSIGNIRNNYNTEDLWMKVAFFAGALLCMVSSLHEGQSCDSEVLSDILSYKIQVGLDVMCELRLIYIFLVLWIVALLRHRVKFMSFVRQNGVLLISMIVAIGIVLYVGVGGNIRTAYMVELSSLILILRLADTFPIVRRWKKTVTAISMVALTGVYVALIRYSVINAQEHAVIESQLENKDNIILLESKEFPEFIENKVCRTVNIYSYNTEIFNPDDHLCGAIATNYGIDFIQFMPTRLYDIFLNHPEELEEITDCGEFPFYICHIPDSVNVTNVYYDFRKAESDEIPLWWRPFVFLTDDYDEMTMTPSFRCVVIDGKQYLFCKKIKDYDSRLETIEVECE